MASDVLFSPFQIKGLTLPNRIVMAPMTRSFSPGGVATEEVAAYYRRRGENQVGLILTEGTGVNRPASLNDPNIPRFHGKAELAAWKQVHEEGDGESEEPEHGYRLQDIERGDDDHLGHCHQRLVGFHLQERGQRVARLSARHLAGACAGQRDQG